MLTALHSLKAKSGFSSCTEAYKSLRPGVEGNFRYSVGALSWPPRELHCFFFKNAQK